MSVRIKEATIRRVAQKIINISEGKESRDLRIIARAELRLQIGWTETQRNWEFTKVVDKIMAAAGHDAWKRE